LAERLRSDTAGPELTIFFAALRKRMLRAAYLHADGAILNFCPPEYVRKLNVEAPDTDKKFTLACYIKLFFAEEEMIARRMLSEEMKTYNQIPQYHSMFELAGVSDAIANFDPADPIPQALGEISSSNPSDVEIEQIVGRFREAGVDLPIVYPYVWGDDSFKTSVIRRLIA
jgi:hypothetical protein